MSKRNGARCAVAAGLWLSLLGGCGDGGGEGAGFETGPLMRPGEDCLFCHGDKTDYPKAPRWSLAGTVFPTKSAAVDEGVEGAVVVISTADGNELSRLTTNAAGNFYTSISLPEQYRVAVEYEGERIEMPCTPPTGGCAKCHDRPALGSAPGRIFVPQAQDAEPSSFDCDTWMPAASR